MLESAELLGTLKADNACVWCVPSCIRVLHFMVPEPSIGKPFAMSCITAPLNEVRGVMKSSQWE